MVMAAQDPEMDLLEVPATLPIAFSAGPQPGSATAYPPVFEVIRELEAEVADLCKALGQEQHQHHGTKVEREVEEKLRRSDAQDAERTAAAARREIARLKQALNTAWIHSDDMTKSWAAASKERDAAQALCDEAMAKLDTVAASYGLTVVVNDLEGGLSETLDGGELSDAPGGRLSLVVPEKPPSWAERAAEAVAKPFRRTAGDDEAEAEAEVPAVAPALLAVLKAPAGPWWYGSATLSLLWLVQIITGQTGAAAFTAACFGVLLALQWSDWPKVD